MKNSEAGYGNFEPALKQDLVYQNKPLDSRLEKSLDRKNVES